MIINLATIDFNGGASGGGGKPSVLQEKTATVVSNGSQTILPDEGYDGLSSVNINAAITGASSAIDFSIIGYDADLSTSINAKFNNDVAYSKSLLDAWNPSNKGAQNLYKGNTKLIYAPNIDTSNVNNMSSMFSGCTSLTSVPAFNTSNVTSMSNMFYGCKSLTTVPLFDTSKVTTMQSTFQACSGLTSVPAFDTSNVIYMGSMLANCTSLTSVPEFNTSNVNDMNNMFYGCKSLTSVPLFYTSNVTDMNSMLYNCSGLTSVPAFDTSKVTNMRSCFSGCSGLTSVPALDTSNVTNMDSMFSGCTSLTTIESISVKSMKLIYYYTLFAYSSRPLIRKAVFKDIGTNTAMTECNLTYVPNWGVNSDEIPDARQSLIDSLITYSFDRTSAGYSTCAIKLSKTTFALLTDDEKAQITAKGYTVASA